MRWPKYWSFSFNISPSNEHPGLISFRVDWLDLLAVLGTLQSLIKHHSSKASILQCSTFFPVQLSHPYVTTRKTTALTRWTFFGKVMSLLLNMLSRLVITFPPRSKRLLISWLPLLGIHNEATRSERDTCTPVFIAALFIIARTWKQPRCPSADEWIRKLWYIYTMEYYSAIKKISFESVLMRWMKLVPIIQSEVSQKDKDQYSILTHIYGI